MLYKLILLLTLVPLIELFLLVRLTQLWGSFYLTVGIVAGTGLLGAVLARHEGARVWRRANERLARGELPADGLLDGVLILLAGALLITPGLLTDGVGFLLLIPPTRALVRGAVKRRLRMRILGAGPPGRGEWGVRPIHEEPPPGAPPLEDEDVP
jgi:UPF0716 protein FxsA